MSTAERDLADYIMIIGTGYEQVKVKSVVKYVRTPEVDHDGEIDLQNEPRTDESTLGSLLNAVANAYACH
jgi:hypothetical protein